ncbi:hypothetical protein [Luteolibacter marinus]|uniref:hypothetical protein n=1 Tax=Luteolibacter marinus TaxID=2776705 RepID=UPI001866E7C5|nr:hypothetical protein [Luteolibacter marinus]
MLLARIRFAGIAMICAALSLVVWKTRFQRTQPDRGAGSGEARRELTIPVEIVEAGEEPRLHEVRLLR